MRKEIGGDDVEVEMEGREEEEAYLPQCTPAGLTRPSRRVRRTSPSRGTEDIEPPHTSVEEE
jgi:hypothetical protein